MPPHEGLVHLKEYDIKDSNVELIGSDIDHRVKYNSAASEPAWNNGLVGQECGLFIWRIENFEVVPWPKERTGEFYDGDSYIVLHSYKVEDKLCHDIFFWLGSKTTQDEAGTAAYKTVELDEFLRGTATQHREVQAHPSPEFMALFRRLCVRSGGVRSGFNHVETNEQSSKEAITLLRIFKHPAAARADSVIVHEVEPTWESLDDHDVFVLDQGQKIWVWQGKNCSPMEKAKAAQVVNDMTLAKHLDVEVLSQLESRSKIIVDLLGGKDTSSRLSRRRGLSRSLQEAIGIVTRLNHSSYSDSVTPQGRFRSISSKTGSRSPRQIWMETMFFFATPVADYGSGRARRRVNGRRRCGSTLPNPISDRFKRLGPTQLSI
ncbi:gelsolin family protein [Aspergillus fischeri NRRL 181]|uniref:Villin n=1 Tax=Neosartorya fischeri (strain ATCC 1020 / DSM 3700 / CBS 544.65 / FGSC A1164 / JCM 1740 / NRRL 181 / WB 181) TaxID=331117 RepID=A1DEE8_NEOFI|nr:villin [Aspergillus fischeri NRRL 181]EAW17755.1 villin [Aspergillus fischeri NRRL 181]